MRWDEGTERDMQRDGWLKVGMARDDDGGGVQILPCDEDQRGRWDDFVGIVLCEMMIMQVIHLCQRRSTWSNSFKGDTRDNPSERPHEQVRDDEITTDEKAFVRDDATEDARDEQKPIEEMENRRGETDESWDLWCVWADTDEGNVCLRKNQPR